jgi:ketosteroid isomerase-like protein
MTNVEIVEACFASHVAQDHDTADRLLADDFVFTSPQDDHIDKATWFERCFPTTARLASYDVLQTVATDGDTPPLRGTGRRDQRMVVVGWSVIWPPSCAVCGVDGTAVFLSRT